MNLITIDLKLKVCVTNAGTQNKQLYLKTSDSLQL